MLARARLGTALIDGRNVATELRSEAPLLLRASPRRDHLEVHLVGGAAGPLGGDDLRLDVDIGPGSVVRVRSVAAQLAQPDSRGRSSVAITDARIGAGADVDWHPEPLISVTGSAHRMTTLLRVETGATVRWTDTIVLGRTGEPPGRIAARLRVELDGEPILDHDLVAGLPRRRPAPADPRVGAPATVAPPIAAPTGTEPAHSARAAGPAGTFFGERDPLAGPGANGRALILTSTLLFGPDAPDAAATHVGDDGSRAATLPLCPGAALVVRLTLDRN